MIILKPAFLELMAVVRYDHIPIYNSNGSYTSNVQRRHCTQHMQLVARQFYTIFKISADKMSYQKYYSEVSMTICHQTIRGTHLTRFFEVDDFVVAVHGR